MNKNRQVGLLKGETIGSIFNWGISTEHAHPFTHVALLSLL